MIRLGLVIGQLTVGGAEGQLAELVRALDGAFEPYVYSLGEAAPALAGRLAAAGVTVRFVPGRGVGRLRELTRSLRNDRIELLHSWLFIANAYAAAAYTLGAGRRLITSARNCKVQGRISQLANAIAFRLSDAIVVNSTDVARFVVRHYRAPMPRIRTVHNGVDAERFQPATSEPAIPTIITIGRMVRQKNHELFIRAAGKIAAERPDVRFVLVGDGPLRREIEAQVGASGLSERVILTGERRDVEDLLRSASMFWLTSRWEGMPNVVLEAMASGLPVIATDVGGVRELVREGEEGFVVPSEDTEAFVSRTRLLLADPDRRRVLSANARRRADQFSTPRMSAALATIYHEVMTENRR